MPKHFIHIEVWTTRFLGTEARGRSLLTLLRSVDEGRWIPHRWNAVEPIRKPFTADSDAEILASWTKDQPVGSGNAWNDLLFRRTKPAALFDAHARRWGKAKLNGLWMELDARSFIDADGPRRLAFMLREFITWSDGGYGCVFYSGQAHKRMAQMTPLERLDQAYWLTFFGQPYLDMFGPEKVFSAPCYSIEKFKSGAIIQASPRFDSPEMTDTDELLIALEEYLGPESFAGRGYPEIPCKVPNFDLSETMPFGPSKYCH